MQEHEDVQLFIECLTNLRIAEYVKAILAPDDIRSVQHYLFFEEVLLELADPWFNYGLVICAVDNHSTDDEDRIVPVNDL